jgi:hypothetical protein
MSYHKSSGQCYVTRARKRIYLGANRDEALERYHHLALGMNSTPVFSEPDKISGRLMMVKELANRFLASQQANWKALETTLRSYTYWLGRFLTGHGQEVVPGEMSVPKDDMTLIEQM